MNTSTTQTLEFDKVKSQLMEYAVSEPGKTRIGDLQPSIDITAIEDWLKETTEARRIVDRSSHVPIHSLTGMDRILSKLGKGGTLQPEDLSFVLSLLEEGRRMKRFMADKASIAPQVSSYALSIDELTELAEAVDRCIRNGRVDDQASSELSKIRKKAAVLDDRIKAKLENILRSPAYRQYIQDSLVSMRNGRYVIPIKKEYRRNVDGSVLDASASGSTLFVEPASIRKLQEELNILQIEEQNEEYRILSWLSNMVESHKREISINMETMIHYDFVFAKAKYSKSIGGQEPQMNMEKRVLLKQARHPLIEGEVVPLDFSIGEGYRTLVITGPNTGGKTVALKTVGLLTMMAQSGMHVPAQEADIAIFHDILADIGDGQSIEQSLSTFSSHMKNIIAVLECTDANTLVIMDELGAGTDPGEGMGLAIAILEEVYRKGSTTLATTHYSEIKYFASQHEGFENGCMEFDIHTLKPMYRLKIGQSGESNAFLIALRLGMSKRIIEAAHEITYKEKHNYSEVLRVEPVPAVRNEEMAHSHLQQKEKSQRLENTRKKVMKKQVISAFQIGDCVYISSLNCTGIICDPENAKGEVGVMVKKKKIRVNKKRLSLYIEGSELYPEEYDLNIVLKSKENRKKLHAMSRKHVEGMAIEWTKEE